MKLAADFRQAAREALRGKWPIAILIGLVAVLLGGAGSGGPEVKFNYDVSSGVSTTFGYGGQTIYSTGYGLDPKWSGLLVGGVVYLIVIALVLAAAYFILGSIVGVGYAKYNLGLVDRTEPGFEALFAYLPNWKTTTLTRLWKGLYILLGTILLVIPGLIMGYTYAMTDYILAEHPDMGAGRSDEELEGDDGGQPLAAVLPAIQFHRLDDPQLADVRPWQPCAAPLSGGGIRRVLPRGIARVKR